MADACGASLGWKSDCERQQKEIIDTVKATAQEQVPFNVQGVSVFGVLAGLFVLTDVCLLVP